MIKFRGAGSNYGCLGEQGTIMVTFREQGTNYGLFLGTGINYSQV